MIVKKSKREIAKLREAGRVVAVAHDRMQEAAAVGVTLRDLDDVAKDVIAEFGAVSAFLDYVPRFAPTPFPSAICSSINDVIVHGFATDQVLEDGDLVSIDFGVFLDGWVGDAARSYVVGTPRQEDLDLIAHTEDALMAGIEAAQPGNRMGDIAHAIGRIARKNGYGIPAGWGGHGVGRAMHEDPSVPNEGEPGRGLKLKPGLVIAIEPMFLAGGDDEYTVDDDGWTVRTVSGQRAAHSEHTIAITVDGPQILTLP